MLWAIFMVVQPDLQEEKKLGFYTIFWVSRILLATCYFRILWLGMVKLHLFEDNLFS